MSATVATARSNGSAPHAPSAPGARPPRAPDGVRVRRPARVATGAVVVLVCALVGALALVRTDRRVGVLVMSRTVQPGQVLTAADLATARVAGTGLATMAPSAAPSVIGRAASGRLVAGTPVVAGLLAPAAAPDPTVVELPMALKAGQFPPELVVGDTVLVVPTTPAPPGAVGARSSPGDATAGPTAPRPVAARVSGITSVRALGPGALTTLEVMVPRSGLSALAVASAAGSVVVVKAAAP